MKGSLKEKEFIADCKKEAPQAARFFEKAVDFARSMGYQVGPGKTSDRRYYVVRVKKSCGFVSFCYPNELEIYFHRLRREKYLSEEEVNRLNERLREQGFHPCDSHSHRPHDFFLLVRLDKKMTTDRCEEIFNIYEEILEEVQNSPSNRNDARSRRSRAQGGTGEGDAHRTLKEYIQDNPLSVGIRLRRANAEVERKFPSNDTIDVFFENATTWIGVEVKSDQSDEDDIRRGLYQCVKYQALMEAECSVKDIKRNIRVLLALGGRLPRSLLREKAILDIEVREGVTIPGWQREGRHPPGRSRDAANTPKRGDPIKRVRAEMSRMDAAFLLN